MVNAIIIIAITLLAVVSVAAIICFLLCVLKLNDLIADVNRQAQLLVAEAIEKERLALEDYQQALNERSVVPTIQTTPVTQEENEEETFNPHEYEPK